MRSSEESPSEHFAAPSQSEQSELCSGPIDVATTGLPIVRCEYFGCVMTEQACAKRHITASHDGLMRRSDMTSATAHRMFASARVCALCPDGAARAAAQDTGGAVKKVARKKRHKLYDGKTLQTWASELLVDLSTLRALVYKFGIEEGMRRSIAHRDNPGEYRRQAMGRGYKCGVSDAKRIIAMLAAGQKGKDIAKEMGVTPQVVSLIRTGKLYPEMERPPMPTITRGGPMSDDTVRAIVAAAKEPGVTLASIGQRFGVDRKTIRNIVQGRSYHGITQGE